MAMNQPFSVRTERYPDECLTQVTGMNNARVVRVNTKLGTSSEVFEAASRMVAEAKRIAADASLLILAAQEMAESECSGLAGLVGVQAAPVVTRMAGALARIARYTTGECTNETAHRLVQDAIAQAKGAMAGYKALSATALEKASASAIVDLGRMAEHLSFVEGVSPDQGGQTNWRSMATVIGQGARDALAGNCLSAAVSEHGCKSTVI